VRLIGSIICTLATCVAGAAQSVNTTAKQCGADQTKPAEFVFAKVDDGHTWREYRSVENVRALDLDGGISAQLWEGQDGSFLVRTVEPGEDFWTNTEYCFNKNGKLDQLRFEVRTAWGWAFRLNGSVEDGAIHEDSTGFFDTTTEKPITRPVGADEVPDALKPTLYLQAKQLPFSKLLLKSQHAPACFK
jgi:hypothetical protein